MTIPTTVKRAEEQKREAAWPPANRWEAIQETMTWAARQAGVDRDMPAARLAEDRRKLRALSDYSAAAVSGRQTAA